ncbi:haloacid dehalogenase [Clostridium polyendosporum]|uniref:Haloacid dehalogenase n=1 Tax=Clostridium polyendosporum TaxID=69208 RepID=A0A919VD88_9CLOT|nr:HAD-IIB family hydrolase [Clostridium polyendosporum]GIM27719.1 haloacid dehalogenase [Clostridium polyendosporum]
MFRKNIPSLLRHLLKDMPKNQPVIAGNGSVIFDDNNKQLRYESIDMKTIFKIIDMLRKDYANVYYQFFDQDIVCAEKFESTIQHYYEMNLTLPREYRLELHIISDAKKYLEKNNSIVTKIEICNDDLNLIQEIKDRLEKIPNIEVVGSGLNGIEITKKGLNKGNSLEILAKHYGYSIDECIAVGNDENDIEMIKKVGLGIAVKNAKDYVKEVADYITRNDNNNDAIAEVVKKFIKPAI